MFKNRRRSTFINRTPLRISKSNNDEIKSDNSVRNGKNLIKLNLIYISGPTLSQYNFKYLICHPKNIKSYIRD